MSAGVSVVMPVFNAAATLRRAIASVQNQTYRDWELIAIDDGSTDESAPIIRAAAVEDQRIKLVSRPHVGIVGALTAGLAQARGRFIARMDADDESFPRRLAEQVQFLERLPEIGVASCLVEFGGDRLRCAGYALHVDWINRQVTPDEIAANRFVESPLAHPSVMFRRDLLAKFGGYRDGNFPEDYELWLRWLDAGVRMAKVPEPLLRWNDPPGRLSRRDARYDPEAFFRIKAMWLARELERVAAGRSPWIWGAGRPTRKRAGFLAEHGIRFAGYIDIDPRKYGRTVAGVPVVGPEELPPPGSAFVLGYVASRGARELIRSALRARGYQERADFLVCA